PPGPGGKTGPGGMPPGPDGQPNPGGNPNPAPAPPAVSGSYMTIKPALKTVLDRLEEAKPEAIMEVVGLQADRGNLQLPAPNVGSLPIQQGADNVEAGGFTVQDLRASKVVVQVATQFKTEDDARNADADFRKAVEDYGAALRLFGIN